MGIVVLGGTGNLGTLVAAELTRRGETVRACGRRDGDARDPEVVTRLATGASVAMGLGRGWRGYRAVDTPIIADAVYGDGPREIACGGPEVMTRRQIFELVGAAAGQKRVRGFPVWLARINAAMLRLVHPRIGQFMQFAVGLAEHGVIAPAMGTKRFRDHLAV